MEWINVFFRVLDTLEKYLDNIIHFKNEGIDHNESIMKDLDYILGTDDNEPIIKDLDYILKSIVTR